MDREKVLAEVLENYPNELDDLIVPDAADVMMVIFHIGRMKDSGGFLEVETHKLTGSGFDLAMDLYDKGWRVKLERIFDVLNDMFEDQNNVMLATLLFTSQRMSIAEMKAIGNG
jgi:hypothetical protein